jgi:hypothetical protein
LPNQGPTAASALIKLLARSNWRRARPACAQKAIEPLLLHFVHVQQPVCRPRIERAVLDVLADDPGALLVAAAEQAAAIVRVRRSIALASMIVLMRHGLSRYSEPAAISISSRE